MTQPLTIGAIAIRELDGLFSLNDMHKASGGDAKHEPYQFMRLDSTKALIDEVNSADSRICNFSVRGGHGGTYVSKELVIAYAMWIDAPFSLKVIRHFLNTAQPEQETRQSRVSDWSDLLDTAQLKLREPLDNTTLALRLAGQKALQAAVDLDKLSRTIARSYLDVLDIERVMARHTLEGLR